MHLGTPQESKAVCPDPLDENACCHRQPRVAHGVREHRDQRKHPRQQRAAVIEPVVLIQNKRAEENTPRDDHEPTGRVDPVEVNLGLLGLGHPARDKQHAGEGQPGAGEVPSDQEDGRDEAEDEQRRSQRRELEVFAGMVDVPRLKALDQPKRGDKNWPEDVFVLVEIAPG